MFPPARLVPEVEHTWDSEVQVTADQGSGDVAKDRGVQIQTYHISYL